MPKVKNEQSAYITRLPVKGSHINKVFRCHDSSKVSGSMLYRIYHFVRSQMGAKIYENTLSYKSHEKIFDEKKWIR